MAQQFGWRIDLDKCTGCDTCTIACKSENNTRPVGSPMPFKNGGSVLPDNVSYRWVVKQETGVYPKPIVTFISSSCNHCESPACLASCPVPGAITKRALDGVVVIDQKLCIGCKNCIQACPYGAPQFNSVTQKVEKCTFCTHRLYKDDGVTRTGFQPACVTTCVGDALHFEENFAVADSGMNAPAGFADPALTKPSVKFGSGPATS